MKDARAAFTLVELLLVALLLGLIGLITLPNISRSYANYMMQKEIDAIVYVMRLAQTKAITQNREYRMNVSSGNGEYWLTRKIIDSENPVDEYETLEAPYGKVHRLPENFKITEDLKSIAFYPDGQIGKVAFHVCRAEECYEVTTKEHRGYVRVVKAESK